jgi:hypothetical protein
MELIMKFIILREKGTDKYFGRQFIAGRYTLQWSNGDRLAIFNGKTYQWTEII